MTSAAARTARAAAQWLSLLDGQQRAAAAFDFADAERFRWQYTPGPRAGLPLSDMDPAQRGAALTLLATGLSPDALARARAIMELEPVLRELEREVGRPGWQRRDSEHYWFAVFGEPGSPTWGWRVGGHHVCVHVTVVAGTMCALPLFLGANPATAPDGSRILVVEEDAAFALLDSLDEDQRAVTVLATQAPRDILTGNSVRAEVTAVPSGIRYDDLTAPQRRLFAGLVSSYTGRPLAPLHVDLGIATFAWLGSTRVGEGHYYAVRAGGTLIELDNTQNGANHVHTVVRDLRRDWGEDLLAAHYRGQHR